MSDIIEQQEKTVNKQVKRKKVIFYSAVIVLLAVSALYSVPRVVYAMQHESTDNAYIKGTVIPVSPEIKGRVKSVYIRDNMLVKKGDLLFEIDKDDYLLALSRSRQDYEAALAEEEKTLSLINEAEKSIGQAEAALAKSRTEAAFASREAERYKTLVMENLVSKNSYDSLKSAAEEAGSGVKVAQASLEMAKAAMESLEADKKVREYKTASAAEHVKQAELDLQRTAVKSPVDGRIGQNNAKVGRFIQAGQTVVAIVDDSDIWVEANYKETQVKHIRTGQPVEIKVDAFPGKIFSGHVDSFQPGTGAAFSLLPPENASGNFVKVVQRVPVKILLDGEESDKDKLVIGLSVVPSVRIE
jgi:membrane fusion protein (multidrug efflux system)